MEVHFLIRWTILSEHSASVSMRGCSCGLLRESTRLWRPKKDVLSSLVCWTLLVLRSSKWVTELMFSRKLYCQTMWVQCSPNYLHVLTKSKVFTGRISNFVILLGQYRKDKVWDFPIKTFLWFNLVHLLFSWNIQAHQDFALRKRKIVGNP